MSATCVRAVLAIVALLVASACSSGQPAASSAALTVSLSDKAVMLSETVVPAGKVTLTVVNSGTVIHSIVLLKTDLPHDKIPADPKDAAKVQETGSIATTGQIAVGASKQLVRDLTPGSYVFVCNEPAHYVVGMHVGLVVK